MSSPSPGIGQILGHYRIVEQIGAGGMGVVYRAHDEQLERDVAVKVLSPGTLANEAARKQFRKEALALAKLDIKLVQERIPERFRLDPIRDGQERIPERFRLDPIRDVQVLCPMNRGSLGVRER